MITNLHSQNLAEAPGSGSQQEQMALLRLSYASRLQGRLQHMQDIWQSLLVGPWNVDALDTLHRMAHTVAGSGATFGYAALGTAARELEIALNALRQLDGPPAADERATISGLVQTLRVTLDEGRQEIPPLAQDSESPEVAAPWLPLNRLLLVLTDDSELAAELVAQLSNFSYSVRIVTSDAALREAMLADPAAVLVDVDHPVEGMPAHGPFARHHQHSDRPVPIIVLSVRSDLQSRLEAVRNGGDAYLALPLDTNALVEKIDNLTAHQAPEPYRVLIVDDDPEMAALEALILQQAGMVTEILTDPLRVQQPLVEFRPDLVLMDINMPGCSGIELASVIRQQEAYFSIPIVFASTESNALTQLAAVRLAGDDFLIKPMHPEHLVSSVTARAQRSRSLRLLMMQDNLTGLINHTQMRQQLYLEVARCRREQGNLCFAIVDLDDFRQINNTFGHPVGDRVLRSLSLLLQQRLRKTDVIGRYGGQQFAIILRGAQGDAASRVLTDLRVRFSSIRHRAGEPGFCGTISGGIAELSGEAAADAVSEAALDALAKAKQAGRNCVMVRSDDPDEPLVSAAGSSRFASCVEQVVSTV